MRQRRVKASQSASNRFCWANSRANLCKDFKMNSLQKNQLASGSKSVKVDQTSCEVSQHQTSVTTLVEAGSPCRCRCGEVRTGSVKLDQTESSLPSLTSLHVAKSPVKVTQT